MKKTDDSNVKSNPSYIYHNMEGGMSNQIILGIQIKKCYAVHIQANTVWACTQTGTKRGETG
jgi:hypothetical protein